MRHLQTILATQQNNDGTVNMHVLHVTCGKRHCFTYTYTQVSLISRYTHNIGAEEKSRIIYGLPSVSAAHYKAASLPTKQAN